MLLVMRIAQFRSGRIAPVSCCRKSVIWPKTSTCVFLSLWPPAQPPWRLSWPWRPPSEQWASIAGAGVDQCVPSTGWLPLIIHGVLAPWKFRQPWNIIHIIEDILDGCWVIKTRRKSELYRKNVFHKLCGAWARPAIGQHGSGLSPEFYRSLV